MQWEFNPVIPSGYDSVAISKELEVEIEMDRMSQTDGRIVRTYNASDEQLCTSILGVIW